MQSNWIRPNAALALLVLVTSACGGSATLTRLDAGGPRDSGAPLPPRDFPRTFHVEGNRILDATGQVAVFHGLNAIDPLAQATFGEPELGEWNEEYYATMRLWGANIVRLPIHPSPWWDTPERWDILDQTIAWIAAHDMYVILDQHSVGLVETGRFEETFYETTREQLLQFWDEVSARYADNPHVVFYEIMNEPVDLTNPSSLERWPAWRALAEEAIDAIRANDPDALAIVGGLNYAYDLSRVAADPVDRPGVIYASHPYAFTFEKKPWDEAFGNTAAVYPVMATEIGFEPTGLYRESDYAGSGRYREDVVAYLEARGIGWTAWTFSAQWDPRLLADVDFTPTEAGAFFRSEMRRLNADSSAP